MEQNIKEAVEIALNYGSIDGDHHKMWVIDQMLRKILGNKEYKKAMKALDKNDDSWDEGIAP